ncbi:Dihydrolipoamide acetyltransferase component of pyruvate dehydrogenase complex [Fusarium oxysporum f. sp. albedinis]|nr:Dihydrolipoamide acetyltransferase component of pyruvate dehydrogenase complex [Fusarium oxysporum f. sp. albedinis]
MELELPSKTALNSTHLLSCSSAHVPLSISPSTDKLPSSSPAHTSPQPSRPIQLTKPLILYPSTVIFNNSRDDSLH